MWLLPWEKLPPLVLGPLLILAGAMGLFDVPPDLWTQFKAGVTLAIGIGLLFHGIKNAFIAVREMDTGSISRDAAKRWAAASAPPDYEKYTETQLRQVLVRIDRERFPERAAEIEARLQSIEPGRGLGEH